MEAKSLIIGAHPDDIEVMMGHAAAASPHNHALVATRGERGCNRLSDPDFVQAGLRVIESQNGLATLGIPHHQQHYRDLPDSDLVNHIDKLAAVIAEIVTANGIKQLVTFGPGGFDGHPDHVAAHRAAKRAAEGLEIPLVVRCDAKQPVNPDLTLSGSRQLKVTAMRCHASQYDPQTDPATWPQFELYCEQLECESYRHYQ
jgi:LmbE family N-acetylglucosaminyl deacetylase